MALNNHILTIIEPSIKLDEYELISFKEEEGKSNITDGLGKEKPLVIVNGYAFTDKDISNFIIDSTDTVPTIVVTLVDNQGYFSVDTFPRDGDVLTVRISALQNNLYKDIRIDFDIDMVRTPQLSSVQYGGVTGGAKYTFTGTMKVPTLYSEVCKSYPSGTSVDHLQSVASDLGLGFATNIDTADDKMNMLIANDSILDSIKKRVQHSYVSDDSFQTFSIDPYYYLNYVDLNSMIESDEDFETVKVNFNINMTDLKDSSNDANESEGPLFLTTHSNSAGNNMYIEKYSLVNNAGDSVKLNGYKKNLQYFENDSDEKLVSFGSEALTSKKLKDIEEPLRGRRDEDRYKSEVKTKYMGRINTDAETSNTHLNHNFARIHNKQNMDEIQKMFLDVELASFNPAIHRYQKVPVFIFNETQRQLQVDKHLKDAKNEKGFDASESLDDNANNSVSKSTIDDFLSGFYVIGGIKYKYSNSVGKITQQLFLYRREWPSRINNIG
jgi:hypothetical protein